MLFLKRILVLAFAFPAYMVVAGSAMGAQPYSHALLSPTSASTTVVLNHFTPDDSVAHISAASERSSERPQLTHSRWWRFNDRICSTDCKDTGLPVHPRTQNYLLERSFRLTGIDAASLPPFRPLLQPPRF